MNVSEQLLQILHTEGVRHIFGVAGDALNPLVTALGQQEGEPEDQVKWVKMKHEGNASFAAFAQGELGENIGVCASTVGPGALHLVNGLYNARKERSPVLAITGQVPVEHIGTDYHQEVDLTRVFEDVCAYQAVIRSPEEAPRVILRALRIALSERAVCRVELPADIAEMKAANEDFVHSVFRSRSHLEPPREAIEKAVELIDGVEKVGILAGAGCRGARDEVLALAEHLRAPITHTVRAADIFDHDAPNVVGLTGLIGNPSGYTAVMECDLLLMLGTDFPYTRFLPYDTPVIQVDTRAANIGNRVPVTLGIHGDAGRVARELTGACRARTEGSFAEELNAEFLEWKRKQCESSDGERDFKVMHPQIVARTVSDVASDDAIFVIDTGTSAIWSTNFMNFRDGRRVIGSFNHGSMAVGLPAAIGAQLQYPDREVWALVGDGAFNMSLHDLSTAAEYELPIRIIVMNNAELGFVKIEMEEAGLAPNYDALANDNIDFCAYARLCGGEGVSVTEVSGIRPAIEQAKAAPGPFVVDAHVTGGELSLPPRIEPRQARNFATSKLREIAGALKGDRRQWENIKRELDAWIDLQRK
ncbi:MAG: thiamine pyrophosphate-binding protein [Longimicrobiales bacterium]|nr:thiamine pyrophosphate-binding protein [Longimicrobiales bacterium]